MSTTISVVEHGQDRKNLALADALRLLVETIESWVDHVDEFVVGFTILETAVDAVIVHSRHEVLELVARQLLITVGIRSGECAINLLLELDTLFFAVAHLRSVSLAGIFLFLSERGFPSGLIRGERGEKCLQAGLLCGL